MRIRYRFAAILGLMLVWNPSPSVAGVVASFGSPSYEGSTATLEVLFSFSGDPGDTLEAFQLSVIGSDSLLTEGGTDFGRFSFVPSLPLLSGWDGTPSDFGTDGYVFYSTLSGVLPPSASPYLLGTLSVDLSGLTSDSPLLVTLNGQDPLFPTVAAGMIGGSFDFLPVDAGAATVWLQATPIPEPSGLTLFGLAIGSLLVGLRRRKASPPISARS